MTRSSLRPAAVLVALAATIALARAADDAVDVPQLSAHTFVDLLAEVRPSEEEAKWRAVGWRPTLWKGVIDGHAEKKPVLLWAMNGHPLGQT